MTFLQKNYLVLAALLQVIHCLSNLSVRIPTYLSKGQTADLTCSYNLEKDDLYSVKWYKGRHQFYSYMPHETPRIKIFPIKGMKINVTASDQTRVVIEDVQVSFSGTYLCEVTVSPSYYALMQYANMTIVDIPKHGPVIKAKRQQYQVGETAELLCVAQPSSPPAKLAWFINGEPASDNYVQQISPSRLSLSFPVSGNHFNQGQNSVRLKCVASIADIYWKTAEITILQEKPKFASVMGDGNSVGNSLDSEAVVGVVMAAGKEDRAQSLAKPSSSISNGESTEVNASSSSLSSNMVVMAMVVAMMTSLPPLRTPSLL